MKDRKGQYVFVAVLLLLVATISICYAVFFDKEEQTNKELVVKVTSVVANETQGGKNKSMTFDNNSVDLEVELDTPEAYIVYDVTIENDKDDKVSLKEILGIDSINKEEPNNITFEVIGIKEGDIIDTKTKKVLKVKATRSEDSGIETLTKKAKITFTFE